MKSKIAALTILTSILTAAVAVAEPGPHRGMGEGHERGFGQGERMEKFAGALGLDDAQKSQVQQIMKKYQPQLKEQMQATMTARGKLQSVIQSDKYDEAGIRAASKEVAAAEEALALTRGKMSSEIRPLLTEDQKKNAEALKDSFRQHAGQGRPGGGRFGKGGGGQRAGEPGDIE